MMKSQEIGGGGGGGEERNKNKPSGRAKLVATTTSSVDHHRHQRHHSSEAAPRQRALNSSSVLRMFNKVQVVYYLTRNGHLEHPHYLEVSHLATQPLRLKDVIDRLTVLRGKAMPCQYSWSCKRSYKNGYVWNDLSENDSIYASDGSEYVLKGSEIIQPTHFSEEGLHIKERQQRQSVNYVKPQMNELVMNKSGAVNERHSFSFTHAANQNCEANDDDDDEVEEEEKGSWRSSSNATYPPPRGDHDCAFTTQMEEDESYSLPSTCSTNSDKQPLPPLTPKQNIICKPPTTPSESKRFEEIITIEKEDENRQLTRNTVLLQLIACGGGSVVTKAKAKAKPNVNKKFNFNGAMRSSNIIPCLKQQLSTRGSRSGNAISRVPQSTGCNVYKQQAADHDDQVVLTKEVQEDDEDMMMVRFMSENPRFGNLQSQEKEYFSGTIVEAMTHSSLQGQPQVQPHPHPPVFNKSSSYNEQRSGKAGLQAAVEEDREKEVVEVKGMISKCIPRTKSCLSNSSKSNKC